MPGHSHAWRPLLPARVNGFLRRSRRAPVALAPLENGGDLAGRRNLRLGQAVAERGDVGLGVGVAACGGHHDPDQAADAVDVRIRSRAQHAGAVLGVHMAVLGRELVPELGDAQVRLHPLPAFVDGAQHELRRRVIGGGGALEGFERGRVVLDGAQPEEVEQAQVELPLGDALGGGRGELLVGGGVVALLVGAQTVVDVGAGRRGDAQRRRRDQRGDRRPSPQAKRVHGAIVRPRTQGFNRLRDEIITVRKTAFVSSKHTITILSSPKNASRNREFSH